MEKDELIELKAKWLVHKYKKTKEKGEFRNKIGRILWPLCYFGIIPALSLATIVTGCMVGNIPGVIFAILAWYGCCFITKGLSLNVQNIAIKNAGALGKVLSENQISYEVRRAAIVEYLRQSGCLFFNGHWVKTHSEEIKRMSNGKTGKKILNVGAFMEHGLGRLNERQQESGKKPSLRGRFGWYRDVYLDYMNEKKEIK